MAYILLTDPRRISLIPAASWFACLLALASGPAAPRADAASIASAPVGYVRQEINAPGRLTLLNLGLTGRTLRQSSLTGIHPSNGTIVFDANAVWADSNAFANTCYLEISSGPQAGLMLDIVAVSAAEGSMTLAADVRGVLQGNESYRIRRHRTLASLFGEHNEAGLLAGTQSTADLVSLYNPATGAYDTYYYSNVGGLIGEGWRKTGGGRTPQGGTIIEPTEAVVITRRAGSTFEAHMLLGEVNRGAAQIACGPGFNFVSLPSPDEITLAECGLFTGDAGTGLRAGNESTADLVMFYNPADGSFSSFYCTPEGIWRRVGDAAGDWSTALLGRSGFVVHRREATSQAFLWTFAPTAQM